MIRKSVLDKGISERDTAAFAVSMMKINFVDEKSITKDNEDKSKLTDTRHVSIIDDVIQEHEEAVFTSYLRSAFYLQQNQGFDIKAADSAAPSAPTVADTNGTFDHSSDNDILLTHVTENAKIPPHKGHVDLSHVPTRTRYSK